MKRLKPSNESPGDCSFLTTALRITLLCAVRKRLQIEQKMDGQFWNQWPFGFLGASFSSRIMQVLLMKGF